MSMEIHVFSDRKLASIAQWQQAVDAEGFALRLSTEGSFEALRGFLPAQWSDRQAGFECFHDRAAELHGFSLAWNEFDWSCERYTRTGAMMPDDGLEQLAKFDARSPAIYAK